MKDFKDKVIVITGAGSGIGQELALQLAARGAVLALNDWKAETLAQTWNQLPQSSQGLQQQFDVGDRAAVESFAQKVEQELGRVDVVINNAGMTLPIQPAIYSSIEAYEQVLQVNLWGVIYGSLAFMPLLLKNPGSSLVNISSVFGLFGAPGQAPYNVSKFAVRGFTETLRVEMQGSGVHIACVHPGGIKTNIVRNIETEDSRNHERFIKTFDKQAKTTAAQAAQVIIRGIERQNPRILIGRDARFISRISRLMPSSYERILARWFKPEHFFRNRTKD
ncbi:MAG: SDR family oxidoreductase [Bacteroidota bacterium]